MRTAGASITIIRPGLVRGAGKEKLSAGLIEYDDRTPQVVVTTMTADSYVGIHTEADLIVQVGKSRRT